MPAWTFESALPHTRAVTGMLVAEFCLGAESLDDVSPLLVADAVVDLDTPQNTVRTETVFAVTECGVSHPRHEAELCVEMAHHLWISRCLVDVDTDNGLSTPAFTLLAGFHEVMAVEEVAVESETFAGNFVDELVFRDVCPGFLDHLVTECAVETDVSRLSCKADIIDLAE